MKSVLRYSSLLAFMAALALGRSAAAQQSSGSIAPAVIIHTVTEQVDTTFRAIVWNSGDAVLTGTVFTERLSWTSLSWLEATPVSLSIPPSGSDTITITVRRSLLPPLQPGVLMPDMEGAVGVAIAPPTVFDTIGTYIRIDPNEQLRRYDTLSSSCLSLVFGTNGNIGKAGSDNRGGANLNFSDDCDDSDTIPGEAAIYLYDASPVVFTSPSSGSWSFYAQQHEFLPVDDPCRGPFVTASGNALSMGTMFSRDALLKLESTAYTSAEADDCEFVIYRLAFHAAGGGALNDLVVGFVADWDVPSDSFAWNAVGVESGADVYYQRGVEFDEPQGDLLECQQNSSRYGGIGLIGWEDGAGGLTLQTAASGVAFSRYDSLLTPQSDLDSTALYALLTSGSPVVPDDTLSDRLTIMSIFDDYDLAAGDTLEVWLALGVVEAGTAADLVATITAARAWFGTNYPLPVNPDDCRPQSCCTLEGDVTGDDIVNLTDLTLIVNCMFLTFECNLCFEAMDVSNDCMNNLTDLTIMVQKLFVSPSPFDPCEPWDICP